jgi:hypothetical protein
VGAIESHTVAIYDRGGKTELFRLKDLSEVKWGRDRDAMSTASVKINLDSQLKQKENLDRIDPGRHEMVIFREDEREWEGPINLPQFQRSQCTIGANDTLQYWNRTVLHAAYSSVYPNTEKVVARIGRMARAELARKEALGYNLLSFLNLYVDADDASTSTSTKAFQMYLFTHLDTLAAKSGIDYTVVGRAVHIWDTSKMKMGRTPVVTENDFLSDARVALYGSELATSTTVTDGSGVFATAGKIHPYYGEWELLSNPYTDEEKDAEPPTVKEMAAQATRNLKGRNPVPMEVSIPDNSSINPSGALKVQNLIPGIYVPLSVSLGIKSVTQMQKLQSMRVTETAGGEDVQVSLYPASSSDDAAVA